MLLGKGISNGPVVGLLASIAVFALNADYVFADDAFFISVEKLSAPVAQGAREPSLSTMNDGSVLMSWTEPKEDGFALKTIYS